MDQKEIFMQEAINLAKKGAGFTKTNPLVGAVIVKNNKIISRGYHTAFGKAHAEVEAINNAKEDTKGADIYVNLEPCCHEGKTPPCTKKIIQAGIKKVIIAMQDPNPKVSGKGILELKNAGIEVQTRVLETQAQKLNKFFIHNIETGLPFVAFKAAITANEKLGIKGKKVQISGKESQKFTHQLRQKYDAILVGADTIIIDNPALTVRELTGKKSNPLRIILDKDGKIKPSAKVFQDNNYLLCLSKKSQQKNHPDENVLILPLNKNGYFDLKDLLKKLYQKNIGSILVEGGASIFKTFIEQKIPQIAYYIVSDSLLEDENAISLYDEETVQKFDFEITNTKESGKDTIYEGVFYFE